VHSYRLDKLSLARTPPGRPPGALRYLPFLLTALTAIALSLGTSSAHSASKPPAAPATVADKSAQGTSLGTVTIEATQARRELERRVDHYVASNVVTYLHDALVRWDQPVCPLVAGLPRDIGEFVLTRISQVAKAARAPLAGNHCKANLYVIATRYPDLLLRKWQRRNPGMYRLCNGIGGVRAFIHSRRPVRVWYNTIFTHENGEPANLNALQLPLFSPLGGCVGAGGGGTRIRYSTVQGLTSVFIIVDLNQTKNFAIGQLADYVSLLGLAQIDLAGDPGKAPTILTLFRDPEHAPAVLSPWDEALLYSLYNTSQSNVLQVSLIEHDIVSKITSRQ
jgi:hypothetical protein